MSYDLRPRSGQADVSFGKQKNELELNNQTTTDTLSIGK